VLFVGELLTDERIQHPGRDGHLHVIRERDDHAVRRIASEPPNDLYVLPVEGMVTVVNDRGRRFMGSVRMRSDTVLRHICSSTEWISGRSRSTWGTRTSRRRWCTPMSSRNYAIRREVLLTSLEPVWAALTVGDTDHLRNEREACGFRRDAGKHRTEAFRMAPAIYPLCPCPNAAGTHRTSDTTQINSQPTVLRADIYSIPFRIIWSSGQLDHYLDAIPLDASVSQTGWTNAPLPRWRG
jgi:hypothetical protein